MSTIARPSQTIPKTANAIGKRNPWPYAIIIYFIVFITTMATWIVFAVRNDMDLVRKDYYEEEIRFQDQIDRVNRTKAFSANVGIEYSISDKALNITLPAEHSGKLSKGRIHLYRPSNARLDREIPLEISSAGTQHIDASTLEPGLWKIRLFWTVATAEYFSERSVVVD